MYLYSKAQASIQLLEVLFFINLGRMGRGIHRKNNINLYHGTFAHGIHEYIGNISAL